MRIHELDITKPYALSILSGEKTFDVRFNDAGFQKGDWIKYTVKDGYGSLALKTIDQPFKDKPYVISYVVNQIGLKEGWVVIGIEPYLNEIINEKKQSVKNIDSDIQDLLDSFADDLLDLATDDFDAIQEKEKLCKKYTEYLDILVKNDGLGDPMRTEEFADAVDYGSFTDYDGIGYYVNKNRYCSDLKVPFSPKEIRMMAEKYPWVLWYNK